MAESKIQRPSQLEAAYKSVSDNPQETCAQCRFFDSDVKLCGLIENGGENEITEKGRCDRWEAAAGVSVDKISEAPAEPEADKTAAPAAIEPLTDPIPAVVSTPAQPGIIDRVKALFTGKSNTPAFQVFKASNGQHYWLSRHTNHFEDKDKEILSMKAHEAYVARVNLRLVSLPELWTFHAKNTRHGQADMLWTHAGFVFALGHFDDTPEAKHAIKFYERNKGKVELSHGFTFPKWALKDGVYETYNTFEISTLPEGAAANPYTSFEEITNMALTDKQAKWIVETLGEEALKRVQAAQKGAESDAEVLKAVDTNYKDFADVNGDTEPKPAESNKAGSGEVYANLLAEIIQAQAQVVEEIEALKADKESAQKTHEQELAALRGELTQLKAQANAAPRRAATAPETLVESSLIPEAVKAQMKERDKFWGVEVTSTE